MTPATESERFRHTGTADTFADLKARHHAVHVHDYRQCLSAVTVNLEVEPESHDPLQVLEDRRARQTMHHQVER